ncbi:exodeoxyribonuclease VII small subunit [Candidatus Saccharibacteria bacterium RIFCSPHIGHO2_12_FULL_41_12]|nr:MAG: exodeoxyribonuclease VII small subunit [Candidatus Saccharibacteria bacterium RIFCSPHIGHO2_12_FULL_41_12]
MKKTYKDLKQELDEVLSQLSSGDIDIDDAIALQKKGQKLIEQIKAYLTQLDTKKK